MASNLAQRIAFAVVAIPIALLVVWWGGWPLVAALAVVAVLGARELYDFARRQGADPLERTGLVSAAAIPVLAYLGITGAAGLASSAWFLLGLWLVLVLTIALARRHPDQRPLAATAATILGVAYPAGLVTFLLAIRHLGAGERSWVGAWLVFTPLVITWVCDTAAMFAGRSIGGRKLWPAVSPGKTWAGSIAGVIGALAAVPLLKALVLDRVGVALPLAEGLVMALVFGVVGQVGDLAESLFKREAGLKDSSSLIPGHGGVLDRLDSLYFVLPVAAGLYRLFGLI